MSEFLLELFSEEIPAKMQVAAAKQLLENLEQSLANLSIDFSKSYYFVTPRRITLVIEGLPLFLQAKSIEKKGPKIDAKSEAIEGFLRSLELKKEDLQIVNGFYYAKKLEPEKATHEILKQKIEQILLSFTWPKSMRSSQSNIRWIRPLRNILCLFGNNRLLSKLASGREFEGGSEHRNAVYMDVHEDSSTEPTYKLPAEVEFRKKSNVLPIEFGGLVANNKSFGHRFMANNQLEINSLQDYQDKMLKAFVVLSPEDRKNNIVKQTKEIAAKLKLKAILDEALLNEVTGLVEYPHAILGKIDQKFTHLPKEVLVTAMKVHQRYFYLEDESGNIAPYFITISNVDLGNDEIIAKGNEKVLKARLSDAKFFYEQDLKMPSSEALAKLARMTFHSKLGTMFDKTSRIINLAEQLAKDTINLELELVKKSALLCKTDLVSEIVGEFPELQGIMGKYYAMAAKQEPEVCLAIEEHYRPIDANDKGDISLLGALIAIADKIDSIVGLWIAGEKPTSSKDPFALRRSALGIIKLLRFHKLNFSLSEIIEMAAKNYIDMLGNGENNQFSELSFLNTIDSVKAEIINFLNDRLKFYLKNESFRHDLIIASLASNKDNVNEACVNLEKLQEFIKKPEAFTLVFAVKRILNILAESKQDLSLLVQNELFNEIESSLYNDIIKINPSLDDLLSLVPKINKFFDNVMVNDQDLILRQNRLNLLYNIVNISNKIADFSAIEVA